MYKLAGVTTGPIATNCYTVINETTKEAILIDVAGDRTDLLLKGARDAGAEVIAVLLTHGHFDHMDGLKKVREEFPDLKVYIGEKDVPVLENPVLNLSQSFMGVPVSEKADKTLSDGELIDLIGLSIKCIEGPGHTAEGMCYYIIMPSEDGERRILFDGDTLFHGSVGRSDFPTGDGEALLKNIKEKLFVLPDDTMVFPGHDSRTTIGWEKANNMYF
jgi:glyoxylase-like metal-dependent hydrolase (beta-lactamase superfamily II)